MQLIISSIGMSYHFSDFCEVITGNGDGMIAIWKVNENKGLAKMRNMSVQG